MLQIIKSLLSLLDILFPETIIRVVKQTSYVQPKITTTLRRKSLSKSNSNGQSSCSSSIERNVKEKL